MCTHCLLCVRSVKHEGADTGSGSSYANQISVSVTTSTETRIVAGTRVGNDVRITQMDHWSSFPAFVPHHHMIFFNNIVSVPACRPIQSHGLRSWWPCTGGVSRL